MDRKLQNKLLDLQGRGYKITIAHGPYVDSGWELAPVDDGDITDQGGVMFSSEVYSDEHLDNVSEHDVTVMKVVEGWQTVGESSDA